MLRRDRSLKARNEKMIRSLSVAGCRGRDRGQPWLQFYEGLGLFVFLPPFISLCRQKHKNPTFIYPPRHSSLSLSLSSHRHPPFHRRDHGRSERQTDRKSLFHVQCKRTRPPSPARESKVPPYCSTQTAWFLRSIARSTAVHHHQHH